VSAGSRSQHIRRLTAKYTRWLHIYGSMVSFGLVFFFAVTGLTLNHPQWFEKAQRSVTMKGTIDPSWIGGTTEAEVKKLEIVEYFRNSHGIHGAVSDFRMDERECAVTFKAPGYAADVFIDRASGTFELTETRMGLGAIVNDLHKGRDAGPGWKIFIDVSASLLVFISLTGLILLWFVHRHRTAGLLALVAGSLLVGLIYATLVP
jgi:uncharacterized protein